MKGSRILGIVLIVIGVISLAYQGITYTTQKKIIDMGPIHATKDEHHTISLPPVIGIVALIGGAVVLVLGKRGD
jgi:drug/metabolite transporter (DMT)-like permease